jgi:hypothetical protein
MGLGIAGSGPRPAFIAVAAATVLGLYALTGLRTWDGDVYAYGAAARDVLRGEALYRTAWQDKPPLGLLAYAIPQLVMPGSTIALQMFLGLCVIAQAAVVWRLVPAAQSDRALVAGLVVLLPFTRIAYVPLMTEHLSNLFVVVNFALAARIALRGRFDWWEAIVAGAAAALAFNTRQTAVLCVVAPLAAVLLTPGPLGRRLGGVAAGAVGAIAGALAVLALVLLIGGDLSGYRYTVFEYPRLYATADATAVGRKVRTFGAFLLQHVISSPLVLFLAIPFAGLRGRRLIMTLAAGVAAVGAGCVAPLKEYLHYWIGLFPCVAVAWAAWAAPALGSEPRFPRPLTAGVAAFLMINAAAIVVLAIADYQGHVKLDEVCMAVDAAAGPRGTMFAIGDRADYIHFRCRTPPAHAHYNEMQLNSYQANILPRPVDAILAAYLDRPPTVLVVGPPSGYGTTDGGAGRATELVDRLRARYSYAPREPVQGRQIYVMTGGRSAAPERREGGPHELR